MNSIIFKSTSRGLMLCVLFVVSNIANAQWNFNRVETLTDEANRLKEQGLYISAFELYPTIMYQMRIFEGLYTLSQLPLLIEKAAWHVKQREFREADDLLIRAEFYVGKNSNPLENYRKLVLQRFYVPEKNKCFEREDDRYLNAAKDCEGERYFRADSFIAATKMMEKVVGISDNRKQDLISLANIAGITAFCVYGVDGPALSYGIRDNEVRVEENIKVRNKYRPQKWYGVQRRVLTQLRNEFDYTEGVSIGGIKAILI